VRMVETGFAQLSDPGRRSEFDSHTEGWIRELGELVAYLDAR
ncbi:MAG: ATPase, partial [Pseudonocardia sp.]|nr:ATPase [Pseudonocardia sp.]